MNRAWRCLKLHLAIFRTSTTHSDGAAVVAVTDGGQEVGRPLRLGDATPQGGLADVDTQAHSIDEPRSHWTRRRHSDRLLRLLFEAY
jgi:hypothetical protein